MDKQVLRNIIIKSLLNGVLGWLIFALVVRVNRNGITFAQALVIREAILLGIAACLGSFFGYRRLELKKRK